MPRLTVADDGNALEVERRTQGLLDAFGHRRHLVVRRDVLDQDGEFVAAKARHRVGGAHAPVQPAGHGDEQLIADGVPVAVVDGLELIDVRRTAPRSMVRPPRARLTAIRSRSMNAVRFSDCVRPSCAARNDSCSSIRFCTVMSRRNPVNIGGPAEGIRTSDSSTGNSVPSARIAVVSKRRSMAPPVPAARYRARPSRCAARSAGGMINLAISRPITSERRVAERPLRRRIEFDDPPAMIDRDDAVEHGFENAGLAGFALGDLLLDLLSREELPHLGADGR